MGKLSRTEFVTSYADRSGLSGRWSVLGFIEISEGNFLIALPCECGDEGCEGWAMVGPSSVNSHLELYAPEPVRSYFASLKERSNDEA